jgi:hypothetical protein
MVVIVFLGGLITGLVIGWLCVGFLTVNLIKKRKKDLQSSK